MNNIEDHKILPENTLPANHQESRQWKIILLGSFSSIFLIVAFWLVDIAIYSEKTLIFWIWPTIAIILAVALINLFSMVNYSKLIRMVFTVVPVLFYFYFFPKNIYVWIGGILFALLMLWFEQKIRSEEKNRQDFSVTRVAGSSIGIILYAFFILLGLNIYSNTSEEFKADPNRFYNRMGESVVRSARYISGEDRSGIDFTQSLDEYLQTQAEEENSNYANLPEAQKAELARQARAKFFEQFNIEIASDKSLAEIMAQIAVDRIKEAAGNSKFIFPLLFTLIVLALLRTFMFVFRWLSLSLIWLIYRFFLAIKFFRIKKVQVEVDKLEV